MQRTICVCLCACVRCEYWHSKRAYMGARAQATQLHWPYLRFAIAHLHRPRLHAMRAFNNTSPAPQRHREKADFRGCAPVCAFVCWPPDFRSASLRSQVKYFYWELLRAEYQVVMYAFPWSCPYRCGCYHPISIYLRIGVQLCCVWIIKFDCVYSYTQFELVNWFALLLLYFKSDVRVVPLEDHFMP